MNVRDKFALRSFFKLNKRFGIVIYEIAALACRQAGEYTLAMTEICMDPRVREDDRGMQARNDRKKIYIDSHFRGNDNV